MDMEGADDVTSDGSAEDVVDDGGPIVMGRLGMGGGGDEEGTGAGERAWCEGADENLLAMLGSSSDGVSGRRNEESCEFS